MTSLDNVHKKIITDPLYKEALDLVRMKLLPKNIFLIGGKLYRRIIEDILRYPARAESADFDFLCEGIANKAFIESSEYSGGVIKLRTATDIKVDVLDMESLSCLENIEPTLDGYFKVVPLDIQAMAMSIRTGDIIGPGLRAIKKRRIKVNNALSYYYDGNGEKRTNKALRSYAEKAESIRFQIDAPPAIPDKPVLIEKKKVAAKPKSTWRYVTNAGGTISLGTPVWPFATTIVDNNTIA